MEGSTFKLIVEKGPREGETIACRPGSVIRIGRVIKGNTFTIKDAGISSNHMLVEFKDGKWVVSDLDTSNGTLLNKVKLRPMMDFDLRDGDVIKIGEYTSLNVKIEEESKPAKGSRRIGKKTSVDVEAAQEIDVENCENQLRRNPRRGVASKRTMAKDDPSESASVLVPKVQKIHGKSNLGIENCGRTKDVASVADNRTRRGAPKRTRASKDEPAESASASISEAPKISESSKLGQETYREPENLVAVEEKRTRRAAPKRARVSKDEPAESTRVSISDAQEISESSKLGPESYREPQNLIPVEEKKTRRAAPKRVRVLKDEPVSVSEFQKIPESLNVGQESCREVDNVAPVEEKQTRQVALKRTRVSKDNEPSDYVSISLSEVQKIPESLNFGQECCREPQNVAPVEEKQTRRVALKRTRASQEEPSESVSEAPGIAEQSKEVVNTSAIKDDSVPANADKVSNRIDLEKMTLGEWFDYLEVYLPKQIYETTEEIISSMRERAKQFNEFMSQQQDGKGKLPLA